MNKVLRFSNNRVIGFLCRILSCLIPDYSRLRKYKNALLSASDLSMQREIAKGLPIQARIAPTTICNFRCLFCEIHKDNILFPNRSKNTVGLDEIKNYEGFLSNIYSLSFYGGSEEPLLAKEFGDVVSYLKKKYGFRMMVNTNASLMTEKLTDILINNGFDYILVSYHAGSRDGYKALMTGSREKVDRRLRYMKERKEELHKNKPVMAFNFALHKANAGEYIDIFNQSKELGIDEVIVNKYYGGRNRLQDKNVSFDHDVDAGNMTLDLIYNKAEELDRKSVV